MQIVRLAIVILFIFIALPHGAGAQDAAVGAVARIQAEATIDGKVAAVGDSVFSGSTLGTNGNGRLEILFNDKTTLQVGGGSTFVIDDFIFDGGKEPTVKKALFHLAEGSFRVITSKLIDAAPENFTVRTPLASIGIRGTDFWGGYLSPEALDVVMLNGKGVIVTSMGGVAELGQEGEGVTIPDPTRHPEGFSKALQQPKTVRWGKPKLDKAFATVAFD